jgi:hypothetical protein
MVCINVPKFENCTSMVISFCSGRLSMEAAYLMDSGNSEVPGEHLRINTWPRRQSSRPEMLRGDGGLMS